MEDQNSKKTKVFFEQWDDYHQLVDTLDTYALISKALQGEIRGRVLDVGSGGVLNYDTEPLEEVVVVDIIDTLAERAAGLEKVRFQQGDATDLPVASNSFDTVLLQQIIHHLAEVRHEDTRKRTLRAIAEAQRVLRPGGRLVIVESCLSPFGESIERLLYPAFRLLLVALKHPLVFQWSVQSLEEFVAQAGFQDLSREEIELGRWIIQLGVKWPTALTPVKIYKLSAVCP